jgi:hypothetical protein
MDAAWLLLRYVAWFGPTTTRAGRGGPSLAGTGLGAEPGVGVCLPYGVDGDHPDGVVRGLRPDGVSSLGRGGGGCVRPRLRGFESSRRPPRAARRPAGDDDRCRTRADRRSRGAGRRDEHRRQRCDVAGRVQRRRRTGGGAAVCRHAADDQRVRTAWSPGPSAVCRRRGRERGRRRRARARRNPRAGVGRPPSPPARVRVLRAAHRRRGDDHLTRQAAATPAAPNTAPRRRAPHPTASAPCAGPCSRPSSCSSWQCPFWT